MTSINTNIGALVALREVVDLHDDAVDLPVHGVTVPFPAREVGEDAVEVSLHLAGRGNGESDVAAPGEERRVRVERDALGRTEGVAPEGERSRRGLRRVLLAERPRGGVPRVRERPIPRLRPILVQAPERGDREVDLAAHLEERRRVGDAQALRDGPHRPHVRRDVLAGGAVAARRGLDEHAALVRERDRHAVDLELAGVLSRRAAPARDSAQPGLCHALHVAGTHEVPLDYDHRARRLHPLRCRPEDPAEGLRAREARDLQVRVRSGQAGVRRPGDVSLAMRGRLP